jgi:hypothetical protein
MLSLIVLHQHWIALLTGGTLTYQQDKLHYIAATLSRACAIILTDCNIGSAYYCWKCNMYFHWICIKRYVHACLRKLYELMKMLQQIPSLYLSSHRSYYVSKLCPSLWWPVVPLPRQYRKKSTYRNTNVETHITQLQAFTLHKRITVTNSSGLMDKATNFWAW